MERNGLAQVMPMMLHTFKCVGRERRERKEVGVAFLCTIGYALQILRFGERATAAGQAARLLEHPEHPTARQMCIWTIGTADEWVAPPQPMYVLYLPWYLGTYSCTVHA